MKTFFAIVVLLAVSQSAFGRPNTQLERSVSDRVNNCLGDLKENLVSHVDQLGAWGESFVASIVAVQAALTYAREVCDKIIYNDPPSYFEQKLFDICVAENDNLSELEAQRIENELREKVNEQPELLKEYLVEFGYCLIGRN